MRGVIDIFIGTLSKFTEQRGSSDVCEVKARGVLTQWCSLTL